MVDFVKSGFPIAQTEEDGSKTNLISRHSIEPAPFQTIPQKKTRKNDVLAGTLDTDPDYIKFVEEISQMVVNSTHAIDESLQSLSTTEKVPDQIITESFSSKIFSEDPYLSLPPPMEMLISESAESTSQTVDSKSKIEKSKKNENSSKPYNLKNVVAAKKSPESNKKTEKKKYTSLTPVNSSASDRKSSKPEISVPAQKFKVMKRQTDLVTNESQNKSSPSIKQSTLHQENDTPIIIASSNTSSTYRRSESSSKPLIKSAIESPQDFSILNPTNVLDFDSHPVMVKSADLSLRLNSSIEVSKIPKKNKYISPSKTVENASAFVPVDSRKNSKSSTTEVSESLNLPPSISYVKSTTEISSAQIPKSSSSGKKSKRKLSKSKKSTLTSNSINTDVAVSEVVKSVPEKISYVSLNQSSVFSTKKSVVNKSSTIDGAQNVASFNDKKTTSNQKLKKNVPQLTVVTETDLNLPRLSPSIVQTTNNNDDHETKDIPNANFNSSSRSKNQPIVEKLTTDSPLPGKDGSIRSEEIAQTGSENFFIDRNSVASKNKKRKKRNKKTPQDPTNEQHHGIPNVQRYFESKKIGTGKPLETSETIPYYERAPVSTYVRTKTKLENDDGNQSHENPMVPRVFRVTKTPKTNINTADPQ